MSATFQENGYKYSDCTEEFKDYLKHNSFFYWYSEEEKKMFVVKQTKDGMFSKNYEFEYSVDFSKIPDDNEKQVIASNILRTACADIESRVFKDNLLQQLEKEVFKKNQELKTTLRDFGMTREELPKQLPESSIDSPIGNKKLMLFSIWSEGYIATGNSSGASYHGDCAGTSFKDACINHAKLNLVFRKDFDHKRMTLWGCRLFQDREQAARSFG